MNREETILIDFQKVPSVKHNKSNAVSFSQEVGSVKSDSFQLDIWQSDPKIVDKVSSTQDVVKAKEFPYFTPFVALSQRKGRGRRGNIWFSPPGEGLYLSFKIPKEFFNVEHQELSPLSLVVGCAVSETVDGYVLSRIKWPNDIYIGGKKVAGILIEATHNDFVIGIGVNLNTSTFPFELKPYATSIYLETQQKVDFYEFLNLLLRNLSVELLKFKVESFKPFVERINRKLLWRKKKIIIDNRECGKLLGIDDQGKALVLTCFKQLKRLSYGDISIREKR